MYKKVILFITIIYFLSLIDNTEQSKIRQSQIAFKAIRNTIKKPMIKSIGNTIKKSISNFRLKNNNIKNLAFGLKKTEEKYLTIKHTIGRKLIPNLGKEGMFKFKHKTPFVARVANKLVGTQGKKNIWMKSAEQMGGKELRSLLERSVNLMSGKGFGSAVSTAFKAVPFVPVLAAGGIMGFAELNNIKDLDFDETFLDLENIEYLKNIKVVQEETVTERINKIGREGEVSNKPDTMDIKERTKVRIINLTNTCINQNLAFEHYLFHHDDLKWPTIMMWQNDKNIVIGKHQNPWKECYLQKMEKDGVKLARRHTGGGAVYQDLGNSCFTFLNPIKDHTPLENFRERNNLMLQRAFYYLKVDARLEGRNDILTGGKKFSGMAYEVDMGGKDRIKKSLHHGTILFDVNTKNLWNYLNPDSKKLKSKGIDSVVSRVTNLKEINPDINHTTLSEKIIEEFNKYYYKFEVDYQTISDPLSESPKVKEIYNKLISEDWLYKRTPKFTNQMETRFKWGNIDLNFSVENGMIKDGMIYSDSQFPDMIDYMINSLKAKSYEYSVKGVHRLFDNMKQHYIDNEDIQPMIDEMESWVTKNI